jgi:hypothetical protein
MAVTLRARGFGGRELAKDLDAVRVGLSKELVAIRREAAGIVADQTARNMRRGPGPKITATTPEESDNRLPHIADTIYGIAAGVKTRHPAGLVWEHGGVIAPNGSPIRIPKLAMAERAGETKRGDIERVMARHINDLIERNT